MSETEPEEILGGCGWEWDHTIVELGDGAWECSECGAEGWDDDRHADSSEED